MVKFLSKQDHEIITRAVSDVEKNTATKVSAVILPASSPYLEFVLLYGLLFGSIYGLILWQMNYLSDLPIFITIQFGAMMCFDLIPPLRRLCLSLLPSRVLRHRASRMAFEEYHAHHSNNPSSEPYVMFFVSMAEHYVHVITNPVVHARIPGNWDSVTNEFSASVKKSGVGPATVRAITRIGEILKK